MTKMVCTRLNDGHIELKVEIALRSITVEFLQLLATMLRDVRPVPLSSGCERIGSTSVTRCIVILHSHTSDPGIFEAITSFTRIMATIAPIDTIDACGLKKN